MMKHSDLIRFVVIGVFGAGVALAGCGPVEDETTATPSPVPATQSAVVVEITPKVQATAPSTVHVTSEPAATATRVSETRPPTYSPSATLNYSTIPTSTVPLVEGGPWLIFQAAEDPRDAWKLWAMNPDGTGLKKLIDEPVYGYSILPDQPLSDGLTIAYVTNTWDENSDCAPCGTTLKIVNIPDGTVQVSIPLVNAEFLSDGDMFGDNAATDACLRRPIWSPDQTKLAFVGVMDGPSADVYTYDLATGAITRLSDGPDQAEILSWSPDSRYVIHTAQLRVSMPAAATYGIWAARSDGTGNVPLFDELHSFEESDDKAYLSTFEKVHSWPSDTSVLLVSRDIFDSSHDNIRLVDLDTGMNTYIRRCCFDDYVYDKNRNTWLFLVRDDENMDTLPYLVFWENGIERRVELDVNLTKIWWSEQWDTFIGEDVDDRAYRISYQGELEQIAALDSPEESISVRFNLSPDGEWTYWREVGFSYDTGYASGLWVAKVGAEPTLVVDEIIESVFWSPDGSDMYIVSHPKQNNFQYSLNRLNLPSLEPEFLLGEFYPSGGFTWVP